MNTKSILFAVIIEGIIILAQIGWAQKKGFITYAVFDECEGKDSSNYTYVVSETTNEYCSEDSIRLGSSGFIQTGLKGERTIIGVQGFAASRYLAGADVITEFLVLFTSGSLAGKFGMVKTKHLLRDYLKKCSSVLGLSFITYKAQLLISDKLDPNVLISPTGAYDQFKKGCTTICNGRFWEI